MKRVSQSTQPTVLNWQTVYIYTVEDLTTFFSFVAQTYDIHLITVMANQAAIAFENYRLYKKLEVESITDGLTGVYNFRYLIRSIKLEMKRAKRFNYVFSFLMLDVDNLKEYNDRNGHLSGSRALKDIAQKITGSCREIDLVAKYGGDEFALLLPQTDAEGAVRLGDDS